ncbi:hypothetical protein ACFQ0D_34100, partial [Micromonospora zhanjiangensis]
RGHFRPRKRRSAGPASIAHRPGATASAGPGRTVVLVTHRLAGLDRYDEILVLAAGRVIRRGRHDELIRTPGWYRDQWLSQTAAQARYPVPAP